MKAVMFNGGLVVKDVCATTEEDSADVQVSTLESGICGTDVAIINGIEGQAPPGCDFLILGHEAIFEVEEATEGGIATGDLVLSQVRWPCDRLCAPCARGRSDLCLTDRWTEHGIRGRHGFMRERLRLRSDRLVPVKEALRSVAVLIEPLSVVIKGIATVDAIENDRPGQSLGPVVVLGAGAIGILAAATYRARGREVVVIDRASSRSIKADVVRAQGGRYIRADVSAPHEVEGALGTASVVVEASGSAAVTDAVSAMPPSSTLLALGTATHPCISSIDASHLARDLVQHNKAVLGSVNSSRTHMLQAAGALDNYQRTWPGLLESTIVRLPLTQAQHAFDLVETGEAVKVVLSFR